MNRAHLDPQNQTKNLNHFYQEVIVDHFKYPRFKGRINDCRFCQEGKNPLCGDVVSIYCKVTPQTDEQGTGQTKDDTRLQFYFEGSGCSISQASASIMCEMTQNKNMQEIRHVIKHAEAIYTGKRKVNPEDMESDIDALNGVGQFPARIKCAALPWKTLECLIAENFDSKGCPIVRNLAKNLNSPKQERKLRIVSTEI